MSKLQRLSTTDELLNDLEHPDQVMVVLKEKKHRNNNWKVILFWSIVILAVLHLLFLSLPLTIGVKNTTNLLGKTRVIVIPYLPGNVAERPGEVSVIGAFDVTQMAEDDRVIVYGLVDTNYYWEVNVTAVDLENETFTATYDGFSEQNYSFDDSYGTFVKTGNIIDTVLYVASLWRGLLATVVVYGSIIFVYHILVIKELKMVERVVVHE